MSRSRNIKPGFFKNEELSELPFEYRILFQGLWCEADREGRLEDRPKRLKIEIFPYDAVDIDAGLDALDRARFIDRYEVAGTRYIQIITFLKHQNPHKREAESVIPAMAGPRPVQAPEIPEQAEKLQEPARRIPDSPFLIPSTTEANASAAGAAPVAAPVDPIWGTGLAFLIRRSIPEKQARALLGKLRQACGDVETGSLLLQAETDDISDPAPWLMAAASKRRSRAGPQSAQQPPSKTLSAIQTLQAMKHGNVDPRRDTGRPEQAHVLELGQDPGGGHDRGHRYGVG